MLPMMTLTPGHMIGGMTPRYEGVTPSHSNEDTSVWRINDDDDDDDDDE